MITHCKKCDINWAMLWTEDVNDDTYEFCPQCKSELYLGDATDIVSYIKCHITGKITNVETGELLGHQDPVFVPRIPRKIKVYDESYEDFKIREVQAQDDHIADYIRLFESGLSHEEASKQARYEVAERKYHFEETTIY